MQEVRANAVWRIACAALVLGGFVAFMAYGWPRLGEWIAHMPGWQSPLVIAPVTAVIVYGIAALLSWVRGARFRDDAASPEPLRGVARLERFLAPGARAIEHSKIVQLAGMVAAVVTVISVILTMEQVQEDLADRKEERESRRAERIERAWTRLLTRAGGNIGKGEALNTLIAEGQNLSGLDLSCEAIGGWDDSAKKCNKPPIFTRIYSTGHALDEVNFSGTVIEYSIIRSAALKQDSLSNAVIRFTDLSGTALLPRVNGGKVTIRLSSLFNARIYSGYYDIAASNLSLSYFEAPVSPNLGDGNWAWADQPPIEFLGMYKLNEEITKDKALPQVPTLGYILALGRIILFNPQTDSAGERDLASSEDVPEYKNIDSIFDADEELFLQKKPLTDQDIQKRNILNLFNVGGDMMSLPDARKRFPEVYQKIFDR